MILCGYTLFMTKQKMQIIDDLVVNEKHCVLCTTNGIELHTSLMRFVCDHAAMKFYFLSPKNSRKNANLRKNPHVSLLIDRREERIALSIEGVFSPIRTEQTAKAITRLYLMKHPDMRDLTDDPDTELIRILGRTAQLSQGFDDIFIKKLKNS